MALASRVKLRRGRPCATNQRRRVTSVRVLHAPRCAAGALASPAAGKITSAKPTPTDASRSGGVAALASSSASASPARKRGARQSLDDDLSSDGKHVTLRGRAGVMRRRRRRQRENQTRPRASAQINAVSSIWRPAAGAVDSFRSCGKETSRFTPRYGRVPCEWKHAVIFCS